MCISDFTEGVDLIKCYGRVIPIVKSMRRRRDARPGKTTEQAKFNNPMSNCISPRVTFLRFKKSDSSEVQRNTLSRGKRASERTVSSSIPANDKTVEGLTVLSGATGIPKWEQSS